MIDGIKEIGRYAVGNVLTRENYLSGICHKIPEIKHIKNTKFEQYVTILNFNTQTKKIELDFERVVGGKESAVKYLWIGNNIGPKLQVFSTTNNIIYLLTKTLPNIKGRATKNLKDDIEQTIDCFFIKEGKKYVINTSMFDFLDNKVEDIEDNINGIKHGIQTVNTKKEVNEVIKEMKRICSEIDIKYNISTGNSIEDIRDGITSLCNKLIGSVREILILQYRNDILKKTGSKGDKRQSTLTNHWLMSKGLSKDNIAIYTIKINGTLLCNYDEYKDVVYYERVGKLFDSENETYRNNLLLNGTCLIHNGKNIPTTSSATSLELKFYNTDKLGFSSGAGGKFIGNFNICQDCYQYMMIGENVIHANLSTRIGGLNVYIIPHLISPVDNLDINRFSKHINNLNDAIINSSSLDKFQNSLNEYTEFEAQSNSFVINYLFYEKSKSEFKILRLLKDVSPNRLDIIREQEENIINIIDDKYMQNRKLSVSLNNLWRCLPIRKGRDDKYSDFSKYLEIVSAVFLRTNIDYTSLIEQFVDVISIIKFEKDGYNIQPKQRITNKVIQLNFLLTFMNKLNILEGITMNEEEIKNINEIENRLPPEILSYWSHIKIYEDSQKKALFIIGYLVGKVGIKQSSAGHKKKPILRWINYSGMDIHDLMFFADYVSDMLQQYNVLQYNEHIYTSFKLLMDANMTNWKLSDCENVFYIMSGYAFLNFISWQQYTKKIEDKIKQKDTELQMKKKEGSNVTEEESLLDEAKISYKKNDYKKTSKILDSIGVDSNE